MQKSSIQKPNPLFRLRSLFTRSTKTTVTENIWYNNQDVISLIMTHLPTQYLVRTAGVCKSWRQASLNCIQRDYLLMQNILSDELLIEATQDGMNLDWFDLYRLTQTVPDYMTALSEDKANRLWALAALSGDIKWLKKHAKWAFQFDKPQKLCAMRSITFWSALGGQLRDETSYFMAPLLHPTNNNQAMRNEIFVAASLMDRVDLIRFLLHYAQENYPYDMRVALLAISETTLPHCYVKYGYFESFAIYMKRLHERKGSLEQITALLNQPLHNQSIAQLAVEGGHPTILEQIQQLCPDSFERAKRDNSLVASAIIGNAGLDQLKRLIDSHLIDPTHPDAEGLDSIEVAAMQGAYPAFKFLLQYFQDKPEAETNPILYVGLCYAILRGHIPFLRAYRRDFGDERIQAALPSLALSQFRREHPTNSSLKRCLREEFHIDIEQYAQPSLTNQQHKIIQL